MRTAHAANGKGHGCDPVPFQKHTTNELDSPTVGRKSKAISTAVAQLALHGYVVHAGDDGDYRVSRREMSQGCDDLEALQDFARQIGVAS